MFTVRHGYQQHFLKLEDAAHYDLSVYATGKVHDLLWRVEAEFLKDFVAEMRRSHSRIDYLDFACGTGRIISFLEDKVDNATGIDVSRVALDRAVQKVRQATLVCEDITAIDAKLEGQYDLITAFRFMLNAGPDLRDRALKQLALRLKSQHSVLLVNSHGNPFSYKLVFLPYHWLRALLAGRRLKGYLTNRQAVRTIEKAGLKVERTVGMGFVSNKVLYCIPFSAALWLERRLTGIKLLRAAAVNQLFICRRRN